MHCLTSLRVEVELWCHPGTFGATSVILLFLKYPIIFHQLLSKTLNYLISTPPLITVKQTKALTLSSAQNNYVNVRGIKNFTSKGGLRLKLCRNQCGQHSLNAHLKSGDQVPRGSPEWGTKKYLLRGNGKKTIYANNGNSAAHLALELSETAQLTPELRDLWVGLLTLLVQGLRLTLSEKVQV